MRLGKLSARTAEADKAQCEILFVVPSFQPRERTWHFGYAGLVSVSRHANESAYEGFWTCRFRDDTVAAFSYSPSSVWSARRLRDSNQQPDPDAYARNDGPPFGRAQPLQGRALQIIPGSSSGGLSQRTDADGDRVLCRLARCPTAWTDSMNRSFTEVSFQSDDEENRFSHRRTSWAGQLPLQKVFR